MQSKARGQGHKNSNTITSASQKMKKKKKEEPPKEEDHELMNNNNKDWPYHHGLLTIGTFGNNNNAASENGEILFQQQADTHTTTSSFSPDLLSEFTPEEIGKVQKGLTKLLSKKPLPANYNYNYKKQQAAAVDDLPLDRFLNCPSSLEVDRRVLMNPDYDKDEIMKVILGIRCSKDITTTSNYCSVLVADNNNNNNKKKKKKAVVIGGKRSPSSAAATSSISFLLKKMFVCSSGLPPMPSLHDRLPQSRMERLLRAMLKNKMQGPHDHQNSTTRASTSSSASYYRRKLLIDQNRQPQSVKMKGLATVEEIVDQDADNKDHDDGSSKWVKTDSEYIVLEI
uniref:protein DEEPER ROOTING 1-like n=1 Tax=Erigeron canadensis TaxID=72917 RepID=UPI001CB8ECA9|nr:protein DEEPER ROOTING 1-like [Erigeron canadensis]